MGKLGHKLVSQEMGDLTKMREELASILDERKGIKEAIQNLHQRDLVLAAVQYQMEWKIANTEIALGIRQMPKPELLTPDGKNFWDNVVGVPKGASPTKKRTPKVFKADPAAEENL